MGGIVEVTKPGLNPGHRGPWRLMLAAVDKRLWQQRVETLNGLRVSDGASADRAVAPEECTGTGT